jgi:DNA-directed RNA polymerase I, II, and III subunit RPABC2
MSDDGYDDYEEELDFNVDEPEEDVEEEEEELGEEDEIDEETTFDNYESDVFQQTLGAEKKTLPILTKYEKTRIIGLRAQQIARGAPLYIERGLESNPTRLAERELREGKLPYIIRRRLPDDTFEDWKVSELMIMDDGRPMHM